MGYWKEKKKYEQSRVLQNSVTMSTLTEKERERYSVFQEEFSKMDKARNVLLLIFGGLILFFGSIYGFVNFGGGGLIISLLLGVIILTRGIRALSHQRNLAWEKAIARIPYSYEKKK